MAYKRADRVSRLLQQIIGEALMVKVRNADAHKANVQKVEVSENLRHARVYVSVPGDEAQRRATMKALQRATGFFRREIGQQSDLKYVPNLEFVYDDTLEYVANIDRILRSLKKPK